VHISNKKVSGGKRGNNNANCTEPAKQPNVVSTSAPRPPRGFAVLPLAVSAAGQDHVGLLRDISNTGMFFYSKVILTIGSEIHLVVNVSSVDPELTVRCKCRVVRVDPGLAGAATGVGVTIEGYEKT